MNLFDLLILAIAILAWYILTYMYLSHRVHLPSFWFRFSIILNIAVFASVRTVSLIIGMVYGPTIFFSTWGAMIFIHTLISVWFGSRKGL